MYHQRRVVERIVAAEIMKLERRQALIRTGAHAFSPSAPSPRRMRSHRADGLHGDGR
jgi:hypothetical protein